MASTPPAMRGWMVFSRPSSISGNPVTSDTSRTATPACFERPRGAAGGNDLHAQVAQALAANSTTPVLSVTLMSARLNKSHSLQW